MSSDHDDLLLVPCKEAAEQAPPISLVQPVAHKLDKENLLKLKLISCPTDVDLQTYELTVSYCVGPMLEELLIFFKKLSQIFKGQNITTGPDRYAMACRLLKGSAKRMFKLKAT